MTTVLSMYYHRPVIDRFMITYKLSYWQYGLGKILNKIVLKYINFGRKDTRYKLHFLFVKNARYNILKIVKFFMVMCNPITVRVVRIAE